MSDEMARKKFIEFKEHTGRIPDAELDDYWATLKPATRTSTWSGCRRPRT
jgi:hypothetical protein